MIFVCFLLFQIASHQQPSTSWLNDNANLIRGLLIACVVAIVIVFTVRFYLWRRQQRRIACRVHDHDDEAVESAGSQYEMEGPQVEVNVEDDYSAACTGVSVPLLQEVTRL